MEEKYPVADYVSMYLTNTSRPTVEREQGSPVTVRFNPDPAANYEDIKKAGIDIGDMTLEQFQAKVYEPAKLRYSKEREWEAQEALHQFAARPHVNYMLGDTTTKLRPVDAYSSPADPRFVKDQHGRTTRVRTDQQVMDQLGTYRDMAGTYRDMAEYTERNAHGLPVKRGKDGKEYVLTESYNQVLNRSEWAEMPVDQALKQSQVRSMSGPKPMRRGWVDAFYEQFTNAYVDMTDTTAGTLQELMGFAWNKLDRGAGDELMAAGRRSQNLGAVRKSRMSEAYESAAMFGRGASGEKWLGELGNLSGQITAVIGMGYLTGGLATAARGAGAAGNLLSKAIQTVPTMGGMGLYAGAMADQEAKEMGLTMEDRLYLYPKMVAMTALTEAYLGKLMGGRNWLEQGMGFFEDQATNRAVRKGLRDAIAKHMDAVKSRAVTGEVAGEIASEAVGSKGLKLLDWKKKVGQWMEGSRVGRAVTGGLEESFEEVGQGFFENAIKMWHDYSNYGTLDDQGNERTPGQGLYGLYGDGGAHYSELFDGFKEAAVLGFIGGHIPGYFTAKPRETEDLLTNFTVAKHAVEMAYEGKGYRDAVSFVDKAMREDYEFYNQQDEQGVLRSMDAAAVDGKVKRRSDYIAEHLKTQYRLAFQAMDATMTKGDELQKKMGGDKDLLAEGIAMQLNAEQASRELKAMEEAGTVPTDPNYTRVKEKLDKALDYSNKVFNGDVYAHYLAVDLFNRIRKDAPLSIEESNRDFDQYMASPSAQAAAGTIIGDIRSITAMGEQAQANREIFEKRYRDLQQGQKTQLDLFSRFMPAESVIQEMTEDQEAGDLLASVNLLREGKLEMTPRALSQLGDTLEDAKNRTMARLYGQLTDKKEQAKARKDPQKYFAKFDGATDAERELLEMDPYDEFEAVTDLEFNDEKAYEDLVNKTRSRRDDNPDNKFVDLAMRPRQITDEQVAEAVDDEVSSFAGMNSPYLQGEMKSEDPRDGYYLTLFRNLEEELDKEEPSVPSNIMQTMEVLRRELDRKELALLALTYAKEKIEDGKTGQDERDLLLRTFGIYDPTVPDITMNTEYAKELLAMTKNLQRELQQLLPRLIKLENLRRNEMERFERGLREVRGFVLEQLAADLGLGGFKADSEAALTMAEGKVAEALRANPTAIWKEGSGFRNMLNGHNHYAGKKSDTNVWERRINGNHSLFTQGLADFTLDNFHQPQENPLTEEWSTPSFRKHFVLNYAMTLMAGDPSAFVAQLGDIAARHGIPGGLSSEQLMVLQHLEAWAKLTQTATGRRLLVPFENFYRLDSYLYNHLHDGSFLKEEPQLRSFAFLPFLTMEQRAGLDAIRETGEREQYMAKLIPGIPASQFEALGTTRAAVEEDLRNLQRLGVDPQPDSSWAIGHDEHNYLPGTMMVQGNQGSGKTTRLFGTLLEMLARSKQAGTAMDYDVQRPLVVVHSTALMETFKQTMEAMNARLKADGLLEVNMDFVLKKNFFSRLATDEAYTNGKLVVLDEATLLTRAQRRQLLAKQQGAAKPPAMYLMLGDRYQTTDNVIKEQRSHGDVLKSIENMTMSTHNLTMIYRSGQLQFIGQLATNMHHLRFTHTANQILPVTGGRYWTAADGIKRRGMRPFENYEGTDPETALLPHIRQRIALGRLEDIAIVVSGVEEARELVAKLTNSTPQSVDLASGVGSRVFTFDEVEVDVRGNLNIQGLGVEQVYFAANPAHIGRQGFASDIEAWNRMLNTSMGRIRDDGDPTNPASRMGYWSGIVMKRTEPNSGVENPWNIQSNSLDEATLKRAEKHFLRRLVAMGAPIKVTDDAEVAETAREEAAVPAVAPGSSVAKTATDKDNKDIEEAEIVNEEAERKIATAIAEMNRNESGQEPPPPPAAAAAVVEEEPPRGQAGEKAAQAAVEAAAAAKDLEEKVAVKETKRIEQPKAPIKRLFAYPFNVDGKTWTFVKGDTVEVNGKSMVVEAFNVMDDGSIQVDVADGNRENPATYAATDLAWSDEKPRERQVSLPKSDTELFVHHGKLSLRTDTLHSFGTLDPGVGISQRAAERMRSLRMQMFMYWHKTGGYSGGLPLKGIYHGNIDRLSGDGSLLGTAIGSAVIFEVDRDAMSERDLEHLDGMVATAVERTLSTQPDLNKEWLQRWFSSFGHLSTMPVRDELQRADGSVGDYQAMQNLKAALQAKLQDGATVTGHFGFGKNSMVTGSHRHKKAGAKRLLPGFLGEMRRLYEPDIDPYTQPLRKNFAIVQDPDVKPGGETGTYIYYDVLADRGNVKDFLKRPRTGRIEVMSLPLQESAELADADERSFQAQVVDDYLSRMEAVVQKGKTGTESDRHNEWRSMVSDFVRYNRLAMTKHLLGGGKRPPVDLLKGLGLQLVPDQFGEKLQDKAYSVLLEGMSVKADAMGTDRYYFSGTNVRAAEKLVEQLRKLTGDKTLEATLGRMRLPTNFSSGIQLKTLEKEDEWQAHSHLMINSDYSPTLPMPVVETNLRELLTGQELARATMPKAPRKAPQAREVQAEPQQRPQPLAEIPLPNGQTLVAHADGTFELGGEVMTAAQLAKDFGLRYNPETKNVEDAAPAGRNRGRRGKGNYLAHEKPAFPSYESYAMTEDEARQIVAETLGPLFAEHKLTFREGLRFDGVEMYGALHRAGIYLDTVTTEKGVVVERRTPLHEAWHKIFEEVVPLPTYEKVNREAAKRFGLHYDRGVASDELREAIAKGFDQYAQERRYRPDGSRRGKVSGLLRQLYDLVVGLIDRIRGKNLLDRVYYRAYHGRYADAVSAQVRFELETGQLPSNRTFDGLGHEVLAHDKGRANVQLALSEFDGDIDVVYSAQHYVGRLLFGRGFFSPVMDPYETEATMKDTIRTLAEDIPLYSAYLLNQHYGTVAIEQGEEGEVFRFVHDGTEYLAEAHELGLHRQKLTDLLGNVGIEGAFVRNDEHVRFLHVRNMNSQDVRAVGEAVRQGKSAYFLYKLMNSPRLLESLLQREMDRLPIRAILTGDMPEAEAMSLGGFVQDTIDNRSSSTIDVSTRMSDVLRNVIRHTPLLEIDNLGQIADSDGYFDYDIGVKVLEDLYLEASLPGADEAQATTVFDDAAGPSGRYERVRRLAEAKLATARHNVAQGGALPRYDSHLLSIYERFFNPDSLSYGAYGQITGYGDFRERLDAMYDAGRNVGEHEQDEFTDFDASLSHMKRFSAKVVQALDSMFGDVRKARLSKTYAFKTYAKVLAADGKWKYSERPTWVLRPVHLRNDDYSDVRHSLDHQLLAFVLEDPTSFSLSDRFIDTWRSGKSPNRWRSGNPVHVVTSGANAGIYYVPDGLSTYDATNSSNLLARFHLDGNGLLVRSEQNRAFKGDRQRIVGEVFEAFGIQNLYRAKRVFASDVGTDGNWSDFVDIATKFSFVAKNLVGDSAAADGPFENYTWWRDALDKVSGSASYGHGPVAMVQGIVMDTEEEMNMDEEGQGLDSDVSFFTFFFNEMNTIARASATANGTLGSSFVLDANNNRHILRQRPTALSRGIDNSGSLNWANAARMDVAGNTVDGTVDLERVNSSWRHLVDPAGRLLHPFLRPESGMSIKLDKWMSGFRTGIDGREVGDMTLVDMPDFFFGNFLGYLHEQSMSGQRKGWTEVTISPDADRTQRRALEMDIRTPYSDVGGSEWVGHGVLDVRRQVDKDGNASFDYRIAHRDVLYHLAQEAVLRRNYQRQSVNRLATALALAVDRGDITDARTVELVRNAHVHLSQDPQQAVNLLYQVFRDESSGEQRNVVLPQHLRFSGAYEGRDYVVRDGYVAATGYEARMEDPSGQEPVMTAANIRLIERLVKALGGFDGMAWPAEVEFRYKGKEPEKWQPQALLEKVVDDLLNPLYADMARLLNDIQHKPMPSWNIQDTPEHYFGNNLPTVYKGYAATHYIANSYLNSYVSGTPYAYESVQKFNKRHRSATSDYNTPGNADARLNRALSMMRRAVVEDPTVDHVLGNFYDAPGELPTVATVQATDGLTEENPVARLLWHMAYGEELGVYPRNGAAKTIHYAATYNTKHSKATITPDSYGASRNHQLMLARMLDPMGRRFLPAQHPNRQNLYDEFMSRLMPEGVAHTGDALRDAMLADLGKWNAATEATASVYLEDPERYPMLAEVNYATTQKQDAVRKKLQLDELLAGGMLEGGALLPNNMEEAMSAIGMDDWTEGIEPNIGGVSNTIAKTVDEGFENFSAQLFPILLAAHADQAASRRMKERMEAIALRGFDKYLKRLGTSLESFKETLFGTFDPSHKRQYAKRIMTAASRLELDKTGDRGHLQALMYMSSVGMEVKAKGTKTDQLFQSAVRSAGIKFSVAGQRTIINVLHGGDLVDYMGMTWSRKDLLEHLRHTRPDELEHVLSLPGRDLLPMRHEFVPDSIAQWVRSLPNARTEDWGAFESLSQNLPWNELAKTWLGTNTKPLVLVDGERLGVAVPMANGSVTVLWQDDQPVLQLEAGQKRRMEHVDALYDEAKAEHDSQQTPETETALAAAMLTLPNGLRYFKMEQQAKNAYALRHNLMRILPGEVMAPSNYARLVQAEGIPLNQLFGLYVPVVDPATETAEAAIGRLRSEYQQASIAYTDATLNGDGLAETAALEEMDSVEGQLAQLHIDAQERRLTGPVPHEFESLRGEDLEGLKRRIGEGLRRMTYLGHDGQLVIDATSPNKWLRRRAEALAVRYHSTSITAKTILASVKELRKYHDMGPDQQVRIIGELQQQAYEIWLSGAAEEMAHDLLKLESELDVVTVRTPSTGAHSGSHNRVVAFTSTEDNTLRISPMNFTRSGEDLDGDAVTSYHSPYLHPQLDSREDADGFDMMGAYMGFMRDFYADNRHAATIFDPINTKYPTRLADQAKGQQQQLRNSFGTDARTMYESFSGKDGVSNSALRLKQMSFFLSALQNDAGSVYWYNRNIDGVALEEIDLNQPYVAYRQMNAISTVTNLFTDNSKDQVMGQLGVNQNNADTMMQLMSAPEKLIGWVTNLQRRSGDRVLNIMKPMSEQVWDALFYLFDNEVVRRWSRNQQFFASLRQKPSNFTSYYGISATLRKLAAERPEIEQLVSELEKEAELSKNRMDGLSENGRAPRRGTEAYDAWRAEKKVLQNTRRRAAHVRNLLAPETTELLFNLAKAALQAEQMVSFGRVANLNQGLPTSPIDVANTARDIERVAGMPLSTVFQVLDAIESGVKWKGIKLDPATLQLARNGRPVHSKEIFEGRRNYTFGKEGRNRWEMDKKDSEYLTTAINNGMEGAARQEMTFADSFYLVDFLPVIMGNPELRGYLHLLRDKMELLKHDRLTTLPQVKAWQGRLMQEVGRDNWNKSLAKWIEARTEEFFVGRFISDIVKTDPDLAGAFGLGVPVPVDSQDNRGRVSRTLYGVHADLSSSFGTDVWMHHFPQFMINRKENLMASDPQRYSDNSFLANMVVTGNRDIDYLTVARAEKGQENQRRADFKLLPVRDQKLLAIYAISKDGLNYRSGSLIEQLDEWVYDSFSKWATEKVYSVWGVLGKEAQSRELDTDLQEYGNFLLGQANKYLLRYDQAKGIPSTLRNMPLWEDQNKRVPWDQQVPAHYREGKYYRASFNMLFNAWRPGQATVEELQSRLLQKDENAVNEHVHYNLPVSNRTAHLRQMAAWRNGSDAVELQGNYSELTLRLSNEAMAKRYRNGDILKFTDGTVGRITGRSEVDGFPAKTYELLHARSDERLHRGNLTGGYRIEPVRDVRRSTMSFGDGLNRAEAVRQSRALVKAISRAFPRIEVREIRQAQADRMGRRQAEALSFIQDGVVHINLDRVTPSTAVHEMTGHLSSAAMYLYNRPAWERMAKMLQGTEMERLVRRNEPELTGDDLTDEVMATYIGMRTEDSDALFPRLQGNSLWRDLADWVGRFWNKVKAVFLKDPNWIAGNWFQDMSLDQMADYLVEQTVKGKLTAPFTSAEYAAIWGGLRRRSNGRKFTVKDDIGFQDLMAVLENNPFHVNQEQRTINRQASYIFDNVLRQGPRGGKKHYFSALLNENVEFEPHEFETESALKQAARQLAEREQAQRQQMGAKMLDFLQRIGVGGDGDVLAAAKATIRRHYSDKNADDFLLDEVRMLQALMGFDIAEDLALAANDPVLSSTYGIALKNEWLSPNAIVIVHNAASVLQAPGEEARMEAVRNVSISIFNVMDTGIRTVHSREDHFVLGQSDLFEKDGRASEVTLTNSVSDMHKLRQAMALAASEAPAQGRPRLRRLGVVSLYADSNATDQQHGFDYSLTDIDTVLPQARSILGAPAIRPHLGTELATMLDEPHRWRPTAYRQALLDQLVVMADSKRKTDNYRGKLWDEVYTITTEHLDPAKGSQSIRMNRAIHSLLADMRQKEFKDSPRRMMAHPAYVLLTQAAEQGKAVNDIGRLSFKPRNWFMLNFDTPNNFGEPALQHWFDQMQKALWQSNHDLQGIVKQTNAAVDDKMKRLNLSRTDILLKENSRRLFGKLYKYREFEDVETGQKVRINTYEAHWDPNDPDTIKALSAGEIDQKDLEMANKMLDLLEANLVQAVINENLLDGRRRTEEEARNYLFQSLNYRRGMLPVLSKSFGEVLARSVGGNKTDADKALSISSAMLHSNLTEYGLFEVTDKGDDVINQHLGHVMLMQVRQPEMRDFRLGLRKIEDVDGNHRTLLDGKAGLARNASLTENLQSIVNYTAALTTRVEAFQTHFVDTHRNTMQLVGSWGLLNQKAKDSDDIRNMLDTIYTRVVLGRTQELKPISVTLPTGKRLNVSIEATVNLLGKLFSHAVLGLRPQQMLKEALVLLEESYAFGYSNKLADNGLYTTDDLNAAIRLYGKNPELVHKLNEAYLVAMKGEHDLISGRWNVSTLKHIMESDTLHIATSFTNYQVRLVLMVAQMIKDGSLEAHSLDKEGNLVYDPTKDKRFSENGQVTENGRALLQEVRQNNTDTKLKLNGVDQRDTDRPLLGYDHRNAKRLKGVADMFVTGAVSSDTLSAGMSNSFFRAFMLFRSFSIPKLLRWFSGGAKGTIGQYAVDEEGNVIHSAPEFKSILGSMAHYMHQLKKARYNPAEAWRHMTAEDRMNMRQSMIDSVFVLASLASVYGATYVVAYLLGLAGLTDPDEEDPEKAIQIQDGDTALAVLLKGVAGFTLKSANRSVKEMMSDVDPTNIPRSMMEDPFPAFGYAENAMDVVVTALRFSDKEYAAKVAEKLSYQVPGLGLIRDTDFLWMAIKRAMLGVDTEEK